MTLLTRPPLDDGSDSNEHRPSPFSRLFSQLRNRWQSRRTIGPAERLCYFLLALAVAAPIMLSQLGLYTPDIKIEVYLNPWHRFALDLSTWLPDPQGGAGNYNLGLAPVDFAMGILHSLGFSPELSMRFTKLALVLLGAWGAVRFLRDVTGDRATTVTRVALAVVYVANPYAIVGASQLAIQLPYALLPWFLIAVNLAVRRGGWRWPALAALIFFLMSGMNTGVVPIIQCVIIPVLVVWVSRIWGIGWKTSLRALLRILLLIALVSLYWLVPAVFAFGAATNIVDNTETIQTINSVSSYSEVLRGLGMWTMYGQSPVTGPWQPGFMPYLNNPFVIIASFVFPLMALVGLVVSRGRVRLLAFGMALSAAILMVGLNPPDNPTPFGRILGAAFDFLPGAIAFRTTNKAGAGLALGLSILVALGIGALAPRWRTLGQRAFALGTSLVLVGLAAQPAVVGELYTGRWDIPSYWDTVGARLDAGSVRSRVWWLPGEVLARYRWSTDSYDDLPFSILNTRHSMLRTALPTTSPHLSNFLAASDIGLQSGSLSGSAISDAGWYLGVSDILLRNDFDWEAFKGGRPSVVQGRLDTDVGLSQDGTLGRPGQNVISSRELANNPLTRFDADTPPLHFYKQTRAGTIVRSEDPSRTATIDGDGFAFSGAAQYGVLTGQRPFTYAGDLSPAELAKQLGAGHELVFTDSNRRRNINQSLILGALGPTQVAGEPLASNTRTLWPSEPARQGVLDWEGASSVTPFGFNDPTMPFGSPQFAFDKGLATAWQIGDGFTSAVGSGATVRFAAPRSIRGISIANLSTSGAESFRVSAGAASQTAKVDATGLAHVDLGGVQADQVKIEVDSLKPGNAPPVYINHISIDGADILPVIKTSSQLSDLVGGLEPTNQSEIARTPMTVLLERDAQGPLPDDDYEPTLERNIMFPAVRTLQAFGLAEGGDGGRPDKKGCLTASTLNGQALRVKPVGGKATKAPWLFTGCGSVTLNPGTNRLRSVNGVVIDSMALKDPNMSAQPLTPPTSDASVVASSTTETTATFDSNARPQLAVFSQTLGPGWKTTLDGQQVNPSIVDGHAAAIELPAGAAHTVTVKYEPQSSAVWSRYASILALALCLVLWLAPGRLRRVSALTGAPVDPPLTTNPAAGRLWTYLRDPVRAAIAVSIGALVFGGLLIGVLTVALCAVAFLLNLGSRRMFGASLLLLAAAPFAWIAGNVSQWSLASPALVTDNPAPAILTALALAMASLGVLWRKKRP
ncbi:MAG: alpha-(1-_3)-arabinofuranosyltransferase domain-containing protein [Candidatus Nanopelagicales bacterium]